MTIGELGFQRLLEPLWHPTLSPLIEALNDIAAKFAVDPCLVAAIARHESGWSKYAVSFDGNYGRGLMQIDAGFHAFAELLVVYVEPIELVGESVGRPGRRVNVAASVAAGAPVFDAHESLGYALEYLIAPALRHYEQRVDQVECAVAAYNAGIGGVDHAIYEGRPPASATYSPHYVANILQTRAYLASQSARNTHAPAA
ncbi:MAG: lytic transglycosylase domain-containing protein [Vulcanimicrobiaceae bacterium]